MYINYLDLQKKGYSKAEAQSIINQLCKTIPHKSKQVYIPTNRHENSTLLVNLRSVAIDDVIKMCDEKIKKSSTNKIINKKLWEGLKRKLKDKP